MVYAEATLALPLIAGYGYHKGAWKNRKARNYTALLDKATSRERRFSNRRPNTRRLETAVP
jgi:deoxyhypusine synthase